MLRLSIPQQFEDLRLVSDTVADYLARELFKETFGSDGDYTLNDILKECYTIIIQELKEFGITFSLTTDELLEDWYTAKRVYYVRKIVAAEYLKQTLNNKEEIQKISSMLEDDEIDTEFFLHLVECLFPLRSTLVEFKELQDFAVFVISSESFEAHVRAILEYLNDIDAPVIVPDITRAAAYIKKVQESRAAVKIAVDKIAAQIPLIYAKMDKRIIKKLLDDYDMDKISAEDLRIFSLIDLDTTDESLAAYKAAMLQKHHERSPHHIEYWTAAWKNPKPIPSDEHLVLLVAHLVDSPLGNTHAILNEAFSKLLQDGIGIFTPHQVALMQEMASAVIPRS